MVNTDCVPTMLEVAGLPPIDDHPVDGESLVPVLTQSGALERDAVFFHYPNYAFHKKNRLGSAVRSGDHKLIKWFDDGSVELYNLADDIGEQQNLAEQKRGLAVRLEARLDAWLAETGANLPVPIADVAGE